MGLTGGQNSIDEFLPGDLAILVFVNPPEEIHHSRLLMVHPTHVLFTPDIKIEVRKFSQLGREKGVLAELKLCANYSM